MSDFMIKVHATRPGYLSILVYDEHGHEVGNKMMDVERAQSFAELLMAQANIAGALRNQVAIAVNRDMMFGTKEIR
jgi:hypothetical protein